MVMAELITYNPNVGMMAYTEVQMSLQQSGSVDISIDTVPFLIRDYTATADFIELIHLFMTIFYYFVQQINKMFLLYVKKMTHSRGPFVQLIITLLLALTIFYYFVQQINKMFLLYVKKMTHSR